MIEIPSEPKTITELSEASLYSLAMLAGMQLDLFTPLKDGPLTAEQVADSLKVNAEKLKPLLYTLAAAGLVVLEGNLFANTPESDRYLVQGRSDYLGWRHGQFANNWSQIFHTAESIRTGIPQVPDDYASMSAERLEVIYSRRHPISVEAGRDLMSAYDFSRYRKMADIGGGSGGVSLAITDAFPDIKATVIELPSVTPYTQRYVEQANATDRVQVVAADVTAGPLTGSFDVAVFSALIQVLTPDRAHAALQNVGRIIESGGAIYIIGAGILDDSRISPPTALRHGLGAVNRFEEGGSYTVEEHREWLADAGFEDVERVSLPNGTSIIRAHKV